MQNEVLLVVIWHIQVIEDCRRNKWLRKLGISVALVSTTLIEAHS